MPHEPQTEALHNEMLDLLNDFHNFCMENDIRYSLHGGTLLGAIREKGFIPWDDDMDVTMMRGEFEKFKSAFNNLKIHTFEFAPEYCRIYKKIKNNTFIWIDIFIYDYISHNAFMRKIKMINLTLLRAWIKTSDDMKATKAHGLYRGIKYLAINIIHLLGVPFSNKFKLKVADKIYRSFPGSRKYIHRSNDQYIGMIIILPDSSMEKYIMTEFEDTELMVTSQYDLILTTSYGNDYMTPQKFDNDIAAHYVARTEFKGNKS